jgi:hypothetical protein
MITKEPVVTIVNSNARLQTDKENSSKMLDASGSGSGSSENAYMIETTELKMPREQPSFEKAASFDNKSTLSQ